MAQTLLTLPKSVKSITLKSNVITIMSILLLYHLSYTIHLPSIEFESQNEHSSHIADL